MSKKLLFIGAGILGTFVLTIALLGGLYDDSAYLMQVGESDSDEYDPKTGGKICHIFWYTFRKNI